MDWLWNAGLMAYGAVAFLSARELVTGKPQADSIVRSALLLGGAVLASCSSYLLCALPCGSSAGCACSACALASGLGLQGLQGLNVPPPLQVHPRDRVSWGDLHVVHIIRSCLRGHLRSGSSGPALQVHPANFHPESLLPCGSVMPSTVLAEVVGWHLNMHR